MENSKHILTNKEWVIMEVIWKDGVTNFRKIYDETRAFSWSKATINSFLKRMETKGSIYTKGAHPNKLYYPMITKNEAVQEESRIVLQKLRGPGKMLFLSHFIEATPLSKEEIEELEKLLKETKKKE